MKKSKYTSDVLEKALAVRFSSMDLNRKVTVMEWLKELLITLIIEEEGFSGKRPFGNSGWKAEPEAALIKAGILKGKVEDGYIEEVEDSTPLFVELVSKLS